MENYKEGLRLAELGLNNPNSKVAAESFILAAKNFITSIEENSIGSMQNIAVLLKKSAQCLIMSADIINEKIQRKEKMLLKFPKSEMKKNDDEITVDTSRIYPNASLNSVIGMQSAKDALESALSWPLQDPNYKAIKSILFYGAPGVGKSYICSAAANSYGWNYCNFAADQIMDKWVGNSEQAVKKYFQYAVDNQPCLIFIDEVESFMKRRDGDSSEGPTHVKSVLLTQMSTVAANSQVVVVACTNLPNLCDDDFLRRFEKKVYVMLPTRDERKLHLLNLLKRYQHSMSDTTVDKICKLTKGFSGDDLKKIITEVHSQSVRRFIALNPSKDVPISEIILNEECMLSEAVHRRPSTTDAKLFRFRLFEKEQGGLHVTEAGKKNYKDAHTGYFWRLVS